TDTVFIIPPGCAALFCGYGREVAVNLAGSQGNLENTAAICAGIRSALTAKGNTATNVLAFCGDGGTLDIGIQALSGVMERRDRIIYVCYDNEAYMNTGIQGSSSTPIFASTTTTPGGKPTHRKDLVQIAIAHDVPYAATASIHNLADMRKKIEKAKNTDGPAVLHIHTPCPTGWRYDPAKSVELSRAAVETGCWVLYEYENGRVKINSKPKELKPIETYTAPQGRFSGIKGEKLAALQKNIKEYYEAYIERLEKMS
ncbi:MAG: thiamine pyrophosphate-dependent enzyme, partial [Synergistaceae bacterium]|nr:thiamine pyrophosphate-dependent enzyme [Synergistaceae bacterium]